MIILLNLYVIQEIPITDSHMTVTYLLMILISQKHIVIISIEHGKHGLFKVYA